MNLSKALIRQFKIPLGQYPVLLPIKLIALMIACVFRPIINIHLSLLCPRQLLPSIVAPWLRKHNVWTARRSGSVALRPWVTRTRGRSRDPGSVFGYIITNRKSRQASHTGPLPPFVYWGGWTKLPKTKLYQCLLLLHPFCCSYSGSPPPPASPLCFFLEHSESSFQSPHWKAVPATFTVFKNFSQVSGNS